ncbi:NifU family protein [Desulfocurvus vexinensis]|uniref:NifU family protein n=1 Tax=Desulfocurvus vexinensis TaxID=399548 RepID=UPI00048B051C|nr:NifU family protein [Desulfocurvus vexinensis]
MRERVEQALAKVRPALRADGGDVELVEVTPEGVVRVRLTGACKGCPMAGQTLRLGVERVVLKEVPEAVRVEAA